MHTFSVSESVKVFIHGKETEYGTTYIHGNEIFIYREDTYFIKEQSGFYEFASTEARRLKFVKCDELKEFVLKKLFNL